MQHLKYLLLILALAISACGEKADDKLIDRSGGDFKHDSSFTNNGATEQAADSPPQVTIRPFTKIIGSADNRRPQFDLEFSRPVLHANADNIKLQHKNGSAIDLTISQHGNTYRAVPGQDLAPASDYVLSLSSNITDLAGRALQTLHKEYRSYGTTTPPTTPTLPVLESTSPANGAQNVATNSNIELVFSKAVTIAANALLLSQSADGTKPISINITGSAKNYSLKTLQALKTNTQYYLLLKAKQIKDSDGNFVAASKISFTTQDIALPQTINFHAWIGANDSKIDLHSAIPAATEIYSFGNADCDINNINACQRGAALDINSQPISDPNLTLKQHAFYRLKHQNTTAQGLASLLKFWQARQDTSMHGIEFKNKLLVFKNAISINNPTMKIWSSTDGATWQQITASSSMVKASKDVIKYKDKLWIIGGYNVNTKKNNAKVWSSSDGQNWQQITASASFSPRSGHRLTVFKDKLWLIGGVNIDTSNQNNAYTYKNDVWSSSDGVNWQQVTASASFKPRAEHELVVFNDKLWLIGGYNSNLGGYQNNIDKEIWSSSDGKNWSKKTEVDFLDRSGYKTQVFRGKIYLVAGDKHGLVVNDVWSTADGINWQRITNNTRFIGRDGHALTTFKNQLWVIGGRDLHVTHLTYNDVWASADGKNWTEIKPQQTYSGRSGHAAAVFDQKLWVVGGSEAYGGMYDGGEIASNYYLSDVYNTSDAQSWQQITASASFGWRSGHEMIAFKDKLWLIAGQAKRNMQKNDVWSTSDGKNWTEIKPITPIFSKRAGHQLAVYKDALWLIGGNNNNDVWATRDGATWGEMTASASFSKRHGHQVVVFKDKLWLIGGKHGNNDYYNDIWSSTDGINWQLEKQNAEFKARHGHKVVAYQDKLWLVGGYVAGHPSQYSDVWSSSDGTSWQRVSEKTPLQPSQHYSYLRHSYYTGSRLVVFKAANGEEQLLYIDGANNWMSTDGKNWYKSYWGQIERGN